MICYRNIIFPRRRKNLFHHLGIDNSRVEQKQDLLIIKKMVSSTGSQVYKKDLEKFLGIRKNKKDLSGYLGIKQKELEMIKQINQREKSRREISLDSEGSFSTDSSSLWSSS